MAEEYIIQKKSLTNIADQIRSITGTTKPMSFAEMSAALNNCVDKSTVFNCYVGMMPPNNNVGNNGDVFLLL